MAETTFQRILVKLSGEALAPSDGLGVDPDAVQRVGRELRLVTQHGVGLGVVVGAGNLMRGRALAGAEHIHPTTADYMGMLGTVMNALALRDTLIGLGTDAVVYSAIAMPLVCRTYFRPQAMDDLTEGKVLIFAGGTSHPGVTTDMCAAIRANDIDADVLVKATKVDGIFDKDPEKFPDAKKYNSLPYDQVLAERLGVMDLPAMAFCMERTLPVVVLDLFQPGRLAAAAAGEVVGTRVGF